MKVTQNAKKWPQNHQKLKCSFFGLCSTSDDQPSNLRDESHPKCEKMATKLSKSEMLIFRLRSTFDDWLSNPRDESHPKCEKMAAKSSKK